MCDGVIYADPGRRSQCRPKGSPGYAHQLGFLSGVTIWGCNLRGVNLHGVISGIRWRNAFCKLRRSIRPCLYAV